MAWFGPLLTMLLSGAPAPTPATCETPLAWSEQLVRAEGNTASLPLVVVLHGRGQEPAELEWIARSLPPSRVVLLEGPVQQRDGRAWFTRRLRRMDPAMRRAQLDERAGEVAASIEGIMACRPTAGPPVLVGYSQGASVALAVAWARPELVGEVIAVSAFLDPGLDRGQAPTTAPLHFVHGLDDRRLPARSIRRAADSLASSGVDVCWRPVTGSGHALDRRLRKALRAELAVAVSRSPAM